MDTGLLDETKVPTLRENQLRSDACPRLHLAHHRLPRLAMGSRGNTVTQWYAMATRQNAGGRMRRLRFRGVEKRSERRATFAYYPTARLHLWYLCQQQT